MKIPRRTLEALPLSICLATSGYIHAQLYVRSYHFIPTIGPSFHWDAAASMAVVDRRRLDRTHRGPIALAQRGGPKSLFGKSGMSVSADEDTGHGDMDHGG